MFIGHFALGLAAKKIAPRTSLGTLMLSVGFLDILWPFFLLFGWERVNIVPGFTAVSPLDLVFVPYSHSLVAAVAWSVLFGIVYYVFFKHYRRGALVLACGVFSHWVLDFISHRPDMPLLLSGEPRVGLGLWHSLAGTLVVEILMFVGGVWIYSRVTRAFDGAGRWGFILFMIALFVFYLASVFGPPPPSPEAIAFSGPVMLLLFAFPYWFDAHRGVVRTDQPG